MPEHSEKQETSSGLEGKHEGWEYTPHEEPWVVDEEWQEANKHAWTIKYE